VFEVATNKLTKINGTNKTMLIFLLKNDVNKPIKIKYINASVWFNITKAIIFKKLIPTITFNNILLEKKFSILEVKLYFIFIIYIMF